MKFEIQKIERPVFRPTPPDPGCRWCKGTGEILLATTIQPCLECLAPYEGWIWADMDGRDATTVFYFDMDGIEIECVGVQNVEEYGSVPSHPDKVNVGRLCKWARSGRTALAHQTLEVSGVARVQRPSRQPFRF